MKNLAFALSTLMTATALAQNPPAPAETLIRSPRPLVIGHRGYNAIAPENTIPSFKLGLAAGVDLVELDCHDTKDGVPVVIHDFTLDRTTDATNRWGGAKLSVADYAVADLRALDAGRWHSAQFAGTRLPTLGEALEVIEAQGMTLIERKGGKPATLAGLLRERKWINRVIVQSFDWQYLRAFHELAPDQVLAGLGPAGKLPDGQDTKSREKPLSAAWLDELAKTGARVAVWNKEVSADAVKLAHDRGFKVWVYTINDPALADALLDMSVDGLISDNPSLMWRTLALRKR